MTRDKIHPELRGLLTALAGDGLALEDRSRLEQILAEDAVSLEFYRKYMVVEASLRWQSQSVPWASSIAAAISVEPGNGCAGAVPIAPVDAIDAIDAIDAVVPTSTDAGPASCRSSSPVLGFLGGAFCQAGEFLNRPTPFWLLISATVLVPLASLLMVVIMSSARYERLVDERIAAERGAAEKAAIERVDSEQLAAQDVLVQKDAPESAVARRAGEPEPVSVAYLERQSDDARWASQQTAAILGIGLQSGRQLHLTAGLAEIAFESGATVILQAPVTFALDGENAGSLQAGKLTAFVPPEAKGFSVQSEKVTVIDLGTEFGMDVMGQRGVEVHVFTGVVEAELAARDGNTGRGQAESTTLRLEKDVALRVDPLAVTVLKKPADPDHFVRRMPGAGVTDRPFIRNPSFEYPPIETHQLLNVQFGNAMSLPIAGWVECSRNGPASPSTGYQISPYGFTVRRQQFIGPGASHGKQVAALTLIGEKPASKAVTSTWIFQDLGTVSQNDVGRTLRASVDVAVGRVNDAAELGKTFGEGAKADVAFATDVSGVNEGIVMGQAGVKQKLIRSEGVCELTATVKIDESMLGKRLNLRLSVAKDKVEDDSEQYHFDNVRFKVE